MFRIFLIVIMIIAAISFVASIVFANQEKRAPNKWVPIYGLKLLDAKLFVDANSLIIGNSMPDSKNTYNSAEIMVTYASPITAQINGKMYTFSSMVKSLITECSTGLTAPMFDVYFKEATPTRESLPLTGVDYSNTDLKATSIILPKNSALYSTMCPTYI